MNRETVNPCRETNVRVPFHLVLSRTEARRPSRRVSLQPAGHRTLGMSSVSLLC